MGGVGGFIVFIFIIRAIAAVARNGRDGGKKSDIGQNVYPMALLIWAFFVIPFIQFYISNVYIAYAFFALYFVVLFPSIVSRYFAWLGFYKISYYLGTWSFVYFGQDKLAGGLFRGLQACHKLKSEKEKVEALSWLKSKFLNHKGRIFSGDMVLAVIIDAHLVRPRDSEYVAEQLALLDGIGSASVHRKIASYASNLALAPALAQKDWIRMQVVAKQWDKVSYNKTTRFILNFVDRIFNRHYSKVGLWVLNCLNWRNQALINLLQEFADYVKEREATGNDELPLAELWQFNRLVEKQSNNLKKRLSKNKSVWLERATQLGVWDLSQVESMLDKSVNNVIALKTGAVISQEDEQWEQFERHHKNLQYIMHSVENRLHSKSLGYGIQNYLDWMKIKTILHELAVDEGFQSAAFSSAHLTIWNWVADLWNIKKERCLVHFIASNCAPWARDNGFRQMHELMLGLTLGQFK